MVRSPWKRFVLDRDTPGVAEFAAVGDKKLSVDCEALEGRQLLSTVVPAATEFSMPSAVVVTNATAILQSTAPRAFAQFQTAIDAGRAAIACQPGRRERPCPGRGGCRARYRVGQPAAETGHDESRAGLGRLTRLRMGPMGFRDVAAKLVPSRTGFTRV